MSVRRRAGASAAAGGPRSGHMDGSGLGGGGTAMIAATNAMRQFGLPLGV